MSGAARITRRDGYVIAEQESTLAGFGSPRQTATLKAKNVAARRADQFAQIESRIETFYPSRTDWRGVSIILSRESAIALAAELIGADVADVEKLASGQ